LQWKPLISDPDPFNLQIIYTRIDRDAGNRPALCSSRFNVNNRRFFYPASTVKLPVAALALEKIHDLAACGLSRRSRIEIINSLDCPILYDHDEGMPATDPVAFESSIKRMLLVSDNGGYNRLWEFLTRDGVNRRLDETGFGGIRLLHRLSSPCSSEQNRVSNAVRCFDETGRLLFEQSPVVSQGPDINPCSPVAFGRLASRCRVGRTKTGLKLVVARFSLKLV